VRKNVHLLLLFYCCAALPRAGRISIRSEPTWAGGLSGPAIKPTALRLVYHAARAADLVGTPNCLEPHARTAANWLNCKLGPEQRTFPTFTRRLLDFRAPWSDNFG
jgi:hypothetical protein